MSVGNLHAKSITVQPGTITTISITPSQIVTSPNAKGLSIKKRKCLFRDENLDLHLFKYYTQSNCKFECQLKMAYDRCQCGPWDFPHMNSSWPMCDRYGRECFKTMMQNASLARKCACPLDCATTRYSSSIDTTYLDPELICSNKEYSKFLSNGNTGYPPKFILHFKNLMYNKDMGYDTICIERTKNMAIVKFQITDDIITRIKKTQRMTFADFLSNIGKHGTLAFFKYCFCRNILQEELLAYFLALVF